MRTTHTLNESDISEALDLFLVKRGEKRVGDAFCRWTPAGADRPAAFSIEVVAERVKLPSPEPLDEPTHAANAERFKVAAGNVKRPK